MSNVANGGSPIHSPKTLAQLLLYVFKLELSRGNPTTGSRLLKMQDDPDLGAGKCIRCEVALVREIVVKAGGQ